MPVLDCSLRNRGVALLWRKEALRPYTPSRLRPVRHGGERRQPVRHRSRQRHDFHRFARVHPAGYLVVRQRDGLHRRPSTGLNAWIIAIRIGRPRPPDEPRWTGRSKVEVVALTLVTVKFKAIAAKKPLRTGRVPDKAARHRSPVIGLQHITHAPAPALPLAVQAIALQDDCETQFTRWAGERWGVHAGKGCGL